MSLIKETLLNDHLGQLYADDNAMAAKVAFEERVLQERMEMDAQEGEEIDLYFQSVIQNQI